MKIKRTWLHIIVNLSIVIVVLCIAGMSSLFFITEMYVEDEILIRARSYFNSILITGKWNAMYNGVYVLSKKGERPKLYANEQWFTACDGRVFTEKNTSVMIIEISGIAETEGLFSYKMKSLKPINPANSPDEFETMSLVSFKHGDKESYRKNVTAEKTVFRYMAPLYVTEECMHCHKGYTNGNVIGGISVTFDITSLDRNLFYTKYLIIGLGIISLAITGGVFYTSVKHLKRRIDDSKTKIERLEVTDDLTSLYNRIFFFKKLDDEFERARRYGQTLSLILIDIDHFKNINDTYGYQTGDAVLKEIAGIIKSNCRESDTPSRYGAEEFAVILPSTSGEGAVAMAEKLLKKVSGDVVHGLDFTVTISLGISVLSPEDAYSPTNLVYEADSALCRAKEGGGNRYVMI